MPISRTGPVVTGTLANLERGVRSSPMSAAALDAVMGQVGQFAERIAVAYDTQVAAGEVGEGGTGRAGDQPILANRPPRALLYGRIQSGKTVAMILTAALALDNGFKVVVVLTTDNTTLVKQTAARFKDLSGPEVFSSARDGIGYEWEGQEDQLREVMEAEGLVLVCSKNAFNLPQVIRFLQQVDAPSYPVLILDDEADAATPDTTVAARSSGRPNAPTMPSKINRLVVENMDPQNPGLSLGEVLPHSIYVQITATPNVLLLQNSDAPMRPTMHHLLEPGEGYCGGETFFGDFDTRPGRPQPNTIVLIDDNAALMRREVPTGLAASLDFFVLSACARAYATDWPPGGFKHLSHTSHRIGEHELVASHIARHLIRVRRRLRRSQAEIEAYFATAYTELSRSVQPPPPLAELMPLLTGALTQADVIRVNATTDEPKYGPRLNFVVGGNILGRGITIDDLLVTYYIREARTPQMDTVWQHARMYGYRQSYIQYMRVYLPHRLGAMFKGILAAEEELRDYLESETADDPVLINVPRPTRPTRPNALDPSAVRSVRAGRDQINPHYFERNEEAAASTLALLTENGVPITEDDRERRATLVPLTVAFELVNTVAISDNEPGLWQPDLVCALMKLYERQFADGCKVYVRQLNAGEASLEGRAQARLAGPEVALVQRAGQGAPVLVLLYVGNPQAPDGWYPTLVMPRGTPAYVFNSQ